VLGEKDALKAGESAKLVARASELVTKEILRDEDIKRLEEAG